MVDGRVDAAVELAREDMVTAFLAQITHQAVDEFPAALTALREQLPVNEEPVSVLGASLGGAVALQVLAMQRVPVRAVALVNPAVRIRSVVGPLEEFVGQTYQWTAESRRAVDELDFVARAGGLTAQPPLLLVSGERDRPELRMDAAALVDALREQYAHPDEVELISVPKLFPHRACPTLTMSLRERFVLAGWFGSRFRCRASSGCFRG